MANAEAASLWPARWVITIAIMALTILCPNGHKLTAPEEQAGKLVKCPTCATTLRVPSWSGQVETASGGEPKRATATVKPAHREKAATIVFLCPNGHRLNSPANMAGRPGKCPHCGVKFLVPSREGPSNEESGAKGEELPKKELSDGTTTVEGSPAPAPALESTESNEPSQEFIADIEVVNPPTAEDELPIIDMEEVIEPDSSRPATPVAGHGGNGTGGGDALGRAPPGTDFGLHPMAELMLSLWSYRAPGTAVEVRLVDGEVLMPDGYAQELSRRSHCLLAIRQPDGTHTLTAVAWDAVARVSVRGVKSLRAGMFEG
jgi:DNA-directed RNA polymerase subunit RPC12/RpoP